MAQRPDRFSTPEAYIKKSARMVLGDAPGDEIVQVLRDGNRAYPQHLGILYHLLRATIHHNLPGSAGKPFLSMIEKCRLPDEAGGEYDFRLLTALRDVIDTTVQLSMDGAFVYQIKQAQLDTAEVDARTDALTLVSNRRDLTHRLDRVLADGTPGALFFFDLDNFGLINKDHGHAAGDAALQGFANALRPAKREHDTLARYGGDEFVLLMAGLPPALAEERVARLRQAVGNLTITHDGAHGQQTFTISAAVGVTTFNTDPNADRELASSVIERASLDAMAQKRQRPASTPAHQAPPGPPPPAADE